MGSYLLPGLGLGRLGDFARFTAATASRERVFRLGLATSGDGKGFEKHAANPVFEYGNGKHSVLTPTLLRRTDGTAASAIITPAANSRRLRICILRLTRRGGCRKGRDVLYEPSGLPRRFSLARRPVDLRGKPVGSLLDFRLQRRGFSHDSATDLHAPARPGR